MVREDDLAREGDPPTGYLSTLRDALVHKRTLVIAVLVSLVYLGTFTYFGGMFSRVNSSQFLGVVEFPHFELNLNPVAYMPYLAFQPAATWYLEVNVIQAGELALIAALVIVNVALSTLILRMRRSARQTSSWLAGVAPFFASNGACVACSGLPAGLALLPASLTSLVGGLLAMAQFYGIPALLTMFILGIVGLYHWDKATDLNRQRGICRLGK